MKVVVIGAGMAGLACAKKLASCGIGVTVLDKGRGVGGRLATRRAEDGRTFDHGAQYVTAKGAEFAELLESMRETGSAAIWADGNATHHYVGTPGMSALAKYVAQDLDVRLGQRVQQIVQTPDGWTLTLADEQIDCSHLMLCTPAPQTAALLGPQHEFSDPLKTVRMAPCLTLMASLDANSPRPFVSRRDRSDPLSWIALNSSKPESGSAVCWVAQAGPEWSQAHLEMTSSEIAALMVPMLCDRIGADPSDVNYSTAHRWRYALTTQALGESFLKDQSGTLYAGGDWCLAARVEAAWESGHAIAADLLNEI